MPIDPKNWSIETKILTGFALAIAVLAFTGGLAYHASLTFIKTTDAAARSERALAAFESIFSLMNAAESRQRGYIILGEERDLGPRAEALAEMKSVVGELRELLADSPHQLERLPELERRIEERMRLLDWVLEARRAQGLEAARERLRLEPGRHEMSALQSHIDLMVTEETERLERLREAAAHEARRTLITFGLLPILSLGFLTLLFLHIRREIRARSQAEEALAAQALRLHENQARLRAILDTAVDAIIVIDEHGLMDRLNSAAERMFGYPREEMLGKNVSLLMPSPDREQHDAHIQRYLRTGEHHILGIGREVLAQRRDGTVFPVDLAVSEVRVGGRRLFTGLVRDITERKQREQQLAHLVHDLESANEELRNFAYIVSHDLKAPLRAIGSLADWIATDYADKFDDQGREHIRLLTGRVRRMDALIDGILQYSRVGRVRENTGPVDLDALVHETIDLLAPPPHVQVTVDGPLPTVTAERTRMQQVFQNLLSNAIKYLDKPQGLIRVGCVAEGDHWRFSVSDNGPGIEARHHERIFQLFQTLAPRDRIEGTGVGLALVKKITEMYGGRVWLESTPSEGTTFYFTLPRAPHQPQSATGTNP